MKSSRDEFPQFYSEPPTKQKNVTASIYQSLLSVFDEMTPEQRMEFVDLAARYANLDAAARADLLDVLPLYAAAAPEQRANVMAMLKSLAPPKP